MSEQALLDFDLANMEILDRLLCFLVLKGVLDRDELSDFITQAPVLDEGETPNPLLQQRLDGIRTLLASIPKKGTA